MSRASDAAGPKRSFPSRPFWGHPASPVVDFIGALTPGATLEATARGRTLAVSPVDAAPAIEVAEKVLSAVVVNLLQNAFKFSPSGTTVTLTAGASTGLGIGLAFCRWGAEANNGRLYARNLPGTGCIFTVDLPRSGLSATALQTGPG